MFSNKSAQKTIHLHKTAPQVTQELHACIGCNECLLASSALGGPMTIDVLNRERLGGPISRPVAQFDRACYQCGTCVAPCPVGLHRDAMMMWLKVRLLRAKSGVSSPREYQFISLQGNQM